MGKKSKAEPAVVVPKVVEEAVKSPNPQKKPTAPVQGQTSTAKVHNPIEEFDVGRILSALKPPDDKCVPASTLPTAVVKQAVPDVQVVGSEAVVVNRTEPPLPSPKAPETSKDDVPASSPSEKCRVPQADAPVPSLYPIRLPFTIQHRLLNEVQATLERACYAFGCGHMPEVLVEKGWSCVEHGELQTWAQLFLKNLRKFDQSRLGSLERRPPELFTTLMFLRHTAVHREPVTADRAEEFMVAAEQLASLFDDVGCAEALVRPRQEMTSVIELLRRHKDQLESRMSERLRDIAIRKAELDQLEHEVIRETIKADREYEDLTGENWRKPFNVFGLASRAWQFLIRRNE